MAPFYAQGDEPAGEVLQDVFDRMSPDEQAWILQVARPVPRPSFSQEEIQAAAQLFYADVLRIDEEEYGKLLASLLDPRRRECEDDEDPALPLRDIPNFVEDLPPPGPEGDLEILFSIKFYIPHYLRRATGRSVSFWRLGAGYEPFVQTFRAASRDLLRRRAGEDVPTPAMPVEKAPHVARVWLGRSGELLAARLRA
ncbi:hypothetical protein [Candidatus Igneacidithiobacillus taiwanensis]|uniref:hypothetical protein n=1 Tax=Candidatus Igneacidithiobacillus taiwanensis TaxID=1945924 RepID=UPI00289D7BF3|nr:hypothetical protein [Candidatus Igneacidithiobacillus taiwanensis]MCE5359983.1 hypothetical protein [Acidithiobacillus sp.]